MAERKLTKEQKKAIGLLGAALNVSGPALRIAAVVPALAVSAISCEQPSGRVQNPTAHEILADRLKSGYGLTGEQAEAAAVSIKGVIDVLEAASSTINSTIMPSGKQTWAERYDILAGKAGFAEKHLAIVANAAGIGNELAVVFLGDGLIVEAVGGKTEAEIKAEMWNIPTSHVHVAAIEGATVEEIKWGIENGWLPAKTAYTVIHAGQAEVAGNTLSSPNDTLSYSIGANIGGIYSTLITKTSQLAGNSTSVIFSGIIPPANTSIHIR